MTISFKKVFIYFFLLLLAFFLYPKTGDLSISEVSAFEDVASEALKAKLDRKIDLDLRDMDVVDVYKFLAVKGDFNISISKNIQGRVTLYLKNVSIKDSLDIISISNGLGYKILGDNIIHIMTEAEFQAIYGKKFSDETHMKIVYLNYAKPAYILEALKNIKSDVGKVVIDEDTGSVVLIDTDEKLKKMEDAIKQMDHPLETKVFTLRYASPDDVANKLKEKLDNKSVGSVQADARSNQLVIRAFPDRLKEVEEIIKALDKKTKAVLIQVRIIQLVLNPQLATGINWDSVFKKGGKYLMHGLTFSGTFPIASAAASTFGNIAVGNFSSDNFAADIRMLKEVEDTKVLANPSIMILNNKEAKIHIGDKLAYVTTTTIGTGESQRVNEEIHYIDVGVQFLVTPQINDDGYITMSIKPEISSQVSTLTTPQGSEVPLINTTLVETSVIVQDGQTIVIGGLRKDESVVDKQGIPILMDIPGVGQLFRSITSNKKQTEIVILLSPKIVEGNENYESDKYNLKETVQPDKEY